LCFDSGFIIRVLVGKIGRESRKKAQFGAEFSTTKSCSIPHGDKLSANLKNGSSALVMLLTARSLAGQASSFFSMLTPSKRCPVRLRVIFVHTNY
jgi:hypothetical protein